jgi:hypothetical protein
MRLPGLSQILAILSTMDRSSTVLYVPGPDHRGRGSTPWQELALSLQQTSPETETEDA